MSELKKDYIFNFIILGIALFFLYATSGINVTNTSFNVGPKSWPIILVTLLIALSVYGLLKTFIKSRKEQKVETADKVSFKKPLLSFVLIGVYIFLLNIIGFILSTIIYILITAKLLGQKNWLYGILFAVITTIVFVLLFSILLNIPLPRGSGIFRDLSNIIY